jgi:hypothetical protein
MNKRHGYIHIPLLAVAVILSAAGLRGCSAVENKEPDPSDRGAAEVYAEPVTAVTSPNEETVHDKAVRYCEKYRQALQECATAGSLSTCMEIKIGKNQLYMDESSYCTPDGSPAL